MDIVFKFYTSKNICFYIFCAYKKQSSFIVCETQMTITNIYLNEIIKLSNNLLGTKNITFSINKLVFISRILLNT